MPTRCEPARDAALKLVSVAKKNPEVLLGQIDREDGFTVSGF